MSVSVSPIGMGAKPATIAFAERSRDDEDEEKGHHDFAERAGGKRVVAR
jgi:hypothetical protein